MSTNGTALPQQARVWSRPAPIVLSLVLLLGLMSLSACVAPSGDSATVSSGGSGAAGAGGSGVAGAGGDASSAPVDAGASQEISLCASRILLTADRLGRSAERFAVRPEAASDGLEQGANTLEEQIAGCREAVSRLDGGGQDILSAFDALLGAAGDSKALSFSSYSQSEDQQQASEISAALTDAAIALEQALEARNIPVIRDEAALEPSVSVETPVAVYVEPVVTPLTSASQLAGSWHGGALFTIAMGSYDTTNWGELTFNEDGTFSTNTLQGTYTLQGDGKVALTWADRTMTVEASFPDRSDFFPEGSRLMNIAFTELGFGINYVDINSLP
jgi:hypothetical protein